MSTARTRLVQGTLDMLILRTLVLGPAHGHAIAKHIQRSSCDVLQVETGSLYPALRRLEGGGWIAARWENSRERGRELRYYRLTKKGREYLASEEVKWKQLFQGVARVMWPSEGT